MLQIIQQLTTGIMNDGFTGNAGFTGNDGFTG